MKSVYEVIQRPVVSEKSAALAEVAGRYVFQVDRRANKQEIRDAVQQLFSVKVSKVRTLMQHGKEKRFGRHLVRNTGWKKAIVTLAEGQKIELFQN